MLIDRPDAAARLRRALGRAPVVLLTGPRQAGKTTLSRQVGQSAPECTFDAENPVDVARLADPMLALSGLRGLVTIEDADNVSVEEVDTLESLAVAFEPFDAEVARRVCSKSRVTS